MKTLPLTRALSILVARRVRQGLCVCALTASLTAAAAVNPLPLGGPARAGADEAGEPGGPQSQNRGVPALDLPNLLRDGRGNDPVTGDGAGGASTAGIPATALAAYRKAEQTLGSSQPSCHLPWQLVAGIGRVESVHASGYGLRPDGTTAKSIRGPRLDGVQFALIRDTEGGRWDGDAAFDRAVGPMQFIPSTWASWGADGNGDGVKDPHNIFDAALGTARYLCAGDRDLSRSADLDRAVLSYNNSRAYVNAVREWMDTYRGTKVAEVPDNTPATPHRPDPADRGDQGPRIHVAPGPGQRSGGRQTPARGGGAPDRTSKSGGADHGTTNPPVTPNRPPADELAPQPPTPTPEPRPKLDHRTVAGLEPIGDPRLDAEAGQAISRRAQVRAVDAHGHTIPGARVTFRVAGTTGTRFAGTDGDTTTASVTTDARGIATAPALQAGDRPGRLTLTAAALGVRVPVVVLTVTVSPAPGPAADALRLWDPVGEDGSPEYLRAEAGTRFPDLPALLATHRTRPAAGVRITATVLVVDQDGKPEPSTSGPYAEDADGKPVRAWALPPAAADGRVTLPALQADQHPGIYTLRLTTPSGTALDLPLTITPTADGTRAS
ncbi:lytic murein transglycosylase [Streptomyces rimosus]|uniref:lytic murein transglycosylase n=1 Tax=Streptomyces rimosus TaxID=1927 RepID=UPI0037A14B9E